jgi:hypothetical protein
MRRYLIPLLTIIVWVGLLAVLPTGGPASASAPTCDSNTDVAIGKPATASSVNATNQTAAKAVDNNGSSK